MAMISTLSYTDIVDLQKRIKDIGGCDTLADAAQQYVSILYDELKDSIILTRLFATIPFENLPESNKEFVISLAQSSDLSKQIKNDTLVLSLLGTRGAKPEWNDRLESKGHVGIPLASSDFIDRIPMVSRLLTQLGAGIDWIDKADTKIVANVFKNISGVFYVKDAETEVDSKGRKIIPAQDFVIEEGVKSVFGIGGCYVNTSLFFTSIIFLRESIEKRVAEQFEFHANKFKIATIGPVVKGRIFE
jgi:hypothetical protein